MNPDFIGTKPEPFVGVEQLVILMFMKHIFFGDQDLIRKQIKPV